MGTDIHAVMQQKLATGEYVDVPTEYEEARHYKLFSWLAGVRNGYGFAGCKTYEPIKPIAMPRGLPPDFELDGSDDACHKVTWEVFPEWRKKYHEKGEEIEQWMGDHSYSWLTWQEILDTPSPLASNVDSGILSRAEYDRWDKVSPPESWCGGISGPGVVVADSVEAFNPGVHTYVRVEWRSADDEFDYFLKEIRRLVEVYGEGRMVFGFDS